MIRDELNDDEANLLSAMLDMVMNEGDQDDARSIIGMFTGNAQYGLDDIEQEHNTWSTLERIHDGDVMAVVDAVIKGHWIRENVIHVPYSGKYFGVGYAGHKQEINMNSELQVTRDYVKRILRREKELKTEYKKRAFDRWLNRRNGDKRS